LNWIPDGVNSLNVSNRADDVIQNAANVVRANTKQDRYRMRWIFLMKNFGNMAIIVPEAPKPNRAIVMTKYARWCHKLSEKILICTISMYKTATDNRKRPIYVEISGWNFSEVAIFTE